MKHYTGQKVDQLNMEYHVIIILIPAESDEYLSDDIFLLTCPASV